MKDCGRSMICTLDQAAYDGYIATRDFDWNSVLTVFVMGLLLFGAYHAAKDALDSEPLKGILEKIRRL